MNTKIIVLLRSGSTKHLQYHSDWLAWLVCGNWRQLLFNPGFDFDIGARKNTRKRPKHFAIYLDKTQLIPAWGRVWEKGCWLMFRVIKKLGQCLTGQQGYIIRIKMIRGCAWLIHVPSICEEFLPVSRKSRDKFSLVSWHLVDTNHELCETLYPCDCWEGVTGVGSGASNFLSYYPSPQAGKWVKIYNFKFALLDLITARVNQDNNANAWH